MTTSDGKYPFESLETVDDLPTGDGRMFHQTWADGYRLEASCYEITSKEDIWWVESQLRQGKEDVSPQGHHMMLVESYPMTWDALMGNYK